MESGLEPQREVWEKYNAHLQSTNKRYRLLTEPGVKPYWRVWAAEIVRKKRLMQRLKNIKNCKGNKTKMREDVVYSRTFGSFENCNKKI